VVSYSVAFLQNRHLSTLDSTRSQAGLYTGNNSADTSFCHIQFVSMRKGNCQSGVSTATWETG